MTQVTAEHRQQYVKDGFFVLRNVIPADHLELLRRTCAEAIREMDAKMEAAGADVLGINHKGKRYFIGQTYKNHRNLGKFLFSALMADICRATLGESACLHNDQYVVKMEKTGMKFNWHQDGAYVRHRIGDHPECITCWCALDDVNEENGTVYILPASRFGKRELVDHVKEADSNDRVGYFGDDPGDPVIAGAGSIAVFSSAVFHRSGHNPSGAMRRVYLAQYSPVPLRNKPGAFPEYFAQPFLRDNRRVVEPVAY